MGLFIKVNVKHGKLEIRIRKIKDFIEMRNKIRKANKLMIDMFGIWQLIMTHSIEFINKKSK